MKPFERYVDCAEKVLDSNTIFPIHRRLLPPKDAVRVREHFLGDPVDGLPALVGLGGPNSGWAVFHLAFCDMCVKEDVSPLGEHYWRRDHHIPGLLVCAKHSRPLKRPCQVCVSNEWADTPPSPIAACGCPAITIGTPAQLNDESSFEEELDLAYAAERLLDKEYLPQLQVEGIASLTRLGALRLGILRDGRICYRTLNDFLGEMAVDKTFFRVNFDGVSEEFLTRTLRGRSVMRQPLRTILLLRRLYGTWADVERAAKVSENLSIGPEPKLIGKFCGPAAKSLEASKALYGPGAPHLYNSYIEARMNNPFLSRPELHKLLPRAARLLLSVAQRDAADLAALGDAAALDASVTAYIYARAEAVRKISPAVQRTTASLLEGHPLADAWPHVRRFLPRASAVMRRCQEKKSHFRRRLCNVAFRVASKNTKKSLAAS